jgi:hypothetical protein
VAADGFGEVCDAAALAGFAAGLVGGAIGELEGGIGSSRGALARTERVAREGGVDAVLQADDPAITDLRKANRELVTDAERRAERAMRRAVREGGIHGTRSSVSNVVRFDARARESEYRLLAGAPGVHEQALAVMRTSTPQPPDPPEAGVRVHAGYAQKCSARDPAALSGGGA